MLTHVTTDFLLDDGIRASLRELDLELKGEALNRQLDLVNTLSKIPSLDPTAAIASVVGQKVTCDDIKTMAEPLGALIPQMSCFGDVFLNAGQDTNVVKIKSCLESEGIELKVPQFVDTILIFVDKLLVDLGLADAIANLINRAVDGITDILKERLERFSSDNYLVCDYEKENGSKQWKRGSCDLVPNGVEP